MISKNLFFILCVIPALGLADDQTSVAGPVSGFVFDAPSRAIRPVLGVPGASYLGRALASDIDVAGIAPDGSAALAVREGQLFVITNLNTAAPQWLPIEGAISDADQFGWSADGAVAAVYSSAGGRVQMIRNKQAGAVIDLADVPGQVTAMAVSGDSLLIGARADDSGGVYLAAAGAAPRLIAAAGNPAAITVAGADVYVADRARNQIRQIRNFATEATSLLFADGVDSPAGVQLSSDGRLLFAASAGSRTLLVFDVNTRTSVKQIDLDFTPTRLHRFGERSLMLLNAGVPGQEPLYVLDGRDEAAVYFVPFGGEQ